MRNCRFDSFENQEVYERDEAFPHIYQLLVKNVPETGPWDGGPERCEEAAVLLKGGLVSTLEGLRVSGGPCAAVLSVAGFLALRDTFLAGRRFILRMKGGLFAPRYAFPLQQPGNNCTGIVLTDG